MTEGFRSSPPPSTEPSRTPDTARYREDAAATVQRVMGNGVPGDDAPASTWKPVAATDGMTTTTDTAKEQAGQVADSAKQAGVEVADTVKEQAGHVTAEASRQAKQLLSQAQSEVTEQAAATQTRVSEGLHALADELTGMAKNSEQDGPATDIARQAADKAHQAASWLADRDPGALLDEVRSFARRKPGAYLAIALGAGVLAGRLTRGLTTPADDAANSGVTNPQALPPQFTGPQPTLLTPTPNPPAFVDDLPAVPASLAGLGANGALGGPRGDVAR